MVSPQAKATVVLVDDDASVRTALSRLFRSSGFDVEAFGSAQEYLESQKEYAGPSCLVLDLKLPGLDGLGLQEELVTQDHPLPVVFISGHGDVPASVQAMKRGAVDFLCKPCDEEDLLAAIRTALSKDLASRVARGARISIVKRMERLTPRECEVLRHVVAGRLNKQIGAALGIAEKTVKVHRGHMMEKMGVDSVAELVRLAAKAGVEPASDSDT